MELRVVEYNSESPRRTGSIRVFLNGKSSGRGLVFYKGGTRRVANVNNSGTTKLCMKFI